MGTLSALQASGGAAGEYAEECDGQRFISVPALWGSPGPAQEHGRLLPRLQKGERRPRRHSLQSRFIASTRTSQLLSRVLGRKVQGKLPFQGGSQLLKCRSRVGVFLGVEKSSFSKFLKSRSPHLHPGFTMLSFSWPFPSVSVCLSVQWV